MTVPRWPLAAALCEGDLALRFSVLKGVIDEMGDPLAGKLVVVPSNPLGTRLRAG
jgi:predicted dinucleotide-binding enzyme